MNIYLAGIIILILLIICATATMNLHKTHVINLYTNPFEMVLTYGAFLITLFILLIFVIGIENEETTKTYILSGYGIASIILIFQSVRINHDIKSIIIASIGNIVWSTLGLLLCAITIVLAIVVLGVLCGSDNDKCSRHRHEHSDFFDIFTGR